ncbi:MAG: MBOAT family O-acyltransferase [Victivallaceae bacterium]
MLFHTWTFVIFFTITMAVYLLLRRHAAWRLLWLLIASYVFYGWWNPLFLILIFYSTSLEYLAGLMIADTRYKKTWLAVCLLNSVFMLGFFKYAGFFTENLRTLFIILHVPLDVPVANILLPVGISFFTFQSMSYIIDVYYKKVKVERFFIRYAAFVAMFPQMVAGPIERGRNILPQLRHIPVIRKLDVSDGLSLFLIGLVKKVVLADFLAIYVDKVYNNPSFYDSTTLIFATYAFAWQIYFDFSGYTDMARGVAKAMGIRLMLNFNNPYTAVDIGDFWRRWHISLSSWFKDYVYVPLGGNRGFKYKVYWNVLLTMVISGFWHGAAWTFIIWGALNGLGRVLTIDLEKTQFYLKTPKIIKQLLVFHFICLTWIFFRAASLPDAMLILRKICQFTNASPEIPVFLFGAVGLIWVYQLIFSSKYKWLLENSFVRVGGMVTALVLFLIFSTAANKQFIYFQF